MKIKQINRQNRWFATSLPVPSSNILHTSPTCITFSNVIFTIPFFSAAVLFTMTHNSFPFHVLIQNPLSCICVLWIRILDLG